MAKTRVWVLTALFTDDNEDSQVEVMGIYKHLDKAVEMMKAHHEFTLQAWLEDGVKGEDILSISTQWVCVLKVKNSDKQVKLEIYGEDIDND